MTTTIITVANMKGGVGKTTTAGTLAHGLALQGKQVLVIDLDPQGQLAVLFGMMPEMGAFYLLTMGRETPAEVQLIKQFVRNTGRDKLWLIAGNRNTGAAQVMMTNMERPVSAIRDAIEMFTSNGLDFIIFDTSPSLGGIQERAIWAADLLVIPVTTEFFGLDGLNKFMETVMSLRETKEWEGQLLGILPTFYDEQTRESKESHANLVSHFGEEAVLSPIHRATVLRECPAEGRTIFEKDASSRAAAEYSGLVKLAMKHRR